jgi:secreted trypsin-like serine protease
LTAGGGGSITNNRLFIALIESRREEEKQVLLVTYVQKLGPVYRAAVASLVLLGALGQPALAIVNGVAVSESEFQSSFPWAVANQQLPSGDICTAELISPTFIVTAAHCAYGTRVALVGKADDTTSQSIPLIQSIIHPSYNGTTHVYDVAVLKLATPVYSVAPLIVATQAQINSFVVANGPAGISGWGRTTAQGTYATVLHRADITLGGLNVQSTWITYADFNAGPCAGDSGGPMTVSIGGGQRVLAGVADWTQGDLCANWNGAIPLVATYTNVGLAGVRDFIVANVPDLGQTLLPSATADQATTTQDAAINVNVLANDAGFSSPMTVAIVTAPLHGTAIVTGSPGDSSTVRIAYTPASGYTGSDSLVYSVSDGTSGDSAALAITVLADADHDGVPDSQDNCLGVYNPDQRDTNGDGYGNMCDPDLNNDGIVNSSDYLMMKARFGTADPDADFNGDGVVNASDSLKLKWYIGKPPGPSAFHP